MGVKRQILMKSGLRLLNVLPVTQIDFVILDRTPQPFNKNIVKQRQMHPKVTITNELFE